MSAQAILQAATDTTGTGSPIDLILPYLNLGIIVVLVLLFATKTGIVPKWSLDDAEKRHETENTDQDTQHARELADKEAAHARELALKDAQLTGLQTDKDELKRTNEQLTRVAQEQFLPALIEANRLTALYVDTIARRGQGGSNTGNQGGQT